jgi:very-short-patch-repair endonuclease
VNARVGRRTFDFVWLEHLIIVETDGPHHRTPMQLADDKRAAAEAARHGFRLLRVPEEGFDHRQDQVAREIWAALAADIDRLAIKI